jgi:hypothetical protein
MMLPVLLLTAGLSADVQRVALDNPVLVQLHSTAGGEPGTASLFGTGGSVVVEVELGTHDSGQAVSIVEGDCSHLGRGAFALTPTVQGQSTTRIPNVALGQVAGHRRALVVRRNDKPSAPTVACGNISS